ncbi:MAG: polysaccharide deacetylase family protein [Hyphomicrobiaceae bacterium]
MTVTTARVVQHLSSATAADIEVLWGGSAKDLADVDRKGLGKFLSFAGLNAAAAKRGLLGSRYDVAYLTFVPWAHTAIRDAIVAWWAKRLAGRVLLHLHGEGLELVTRASDAKTRLIRWLVAGSELIAITEAAAQEARSSNLFSAVHRLANTAGDPGPPEAVVGERLRLGFIANLDPRKGVLTFVDVLAALNEAGVPFDGHIAGASTRHLSTDDLERQLAQRGLSGLVTVHGGVSGEAKRQFFRGLDALVYLSEHDHAPIVIVESLSHGLVPFVMDTGGVAEMVGPHFARHVMPRGAAKEDLIARIAALLAAYQGEPQTLAADRKAARERYLEAFSEPLFNAQLDEIFRLPPAKVDDQAVIDSTSGVRSQAPQRLKQRVFSISRGVHERVLKRPLPDRLALYFHGLDEAERENMAQGVNALRELGYRSVSMDAYIDPATKGRVFNVSLDDNYVSWYRALPFLDKLQLRATFYTNSLPFRDIADEAAIEAYFKRLDYPGTIGALSRQELRAIAAAGHEIGCHTHSHLMIASLPRSQWDEEIKSSKSILQDIIGQPVRHFSWPYGMPRHITAAQRRYCVGIGFASLAAATPAMQFADKANTMNVQRSEWRVDRSKIENLGDLAIDGRYFTGLTGRSAID